MLHCGGVLRRFKCIDKIKTKWAVLCFLLIQIMLLIGNTTLSYIKGSLYIPLCKDCSLFMLVSACCILIICVKCPTHSRIVNKLAAYVFPVYLSEGMVRTIIERSSIIVVEDNIDMVKNIAILAFFTALISLILGLIVENTLGRFGKKIIDFKIRTINRMLPIFFSKVFDNPLWK